jgi:hypothetical protein
MKTSDSPPRRRSSRIDRLVKSPYPLPPDGPTSPIYVPYHVRQSDYSGLLQPTQPMRITKRNKKRNKKRSRAVRLLLRLTLALTLMTGCSTLGFLGARLYRLYTFAQSVTGQALLTVAGTQVPQAAPLGSDLARVPAFNLLLPGSDNDSKPPFQNAALTQTDSQAIQDNQGAVHH